MKGLEGHARGVAIAVAGVVAVTPDAALMMWAEATGASLVAIVFWKLLFMALLVFAYARWAHEGDSALLWRPLVQHPLKAWGLGTAIALSIVSLSFAFTMTAAANAVLCFSMHPLVSAVLGYYCLGDVLAMKTKVALVGAVVSLFVMFAPGIVASGGLGEGSLGDILALGSAVLTAIFITASRGASRAVPDLSVELCSAVGLASTALLMAAFDWARQVQVGGKLLNNIIISTPPGDVVTRGMTAATVLACALDGLAVACINVSFSVAATFISAAQVGLFALIETVFGPVWVFFIFGQVPPISTLIGGAMIVCVLAAHELVDDVCPPRTMAQAAGSNERSDLRDQDQSAKYSALAGP